MKDLVDITEEWTNNYLEHMLNQAPSLKEEFRNSITDVFVKEDDRVVHIKIVQDEDFYPLVKDPLNENHYKVRVF